MSNNIEVMNTTELKKKSLDAKAITILVTSWIGQTRGDQVENAAYFQQKGLCRVLSQDHLFTLPQALEETFADERMKENLQNSTFCQGNESILRELRKILHA